MYFWRRSGSRQDAGLQPTPGERLVRRTRAGLAVFTLALIAILLAAVGLVTAAAAVGVTDQSVDANLHAAAENMLIALAPKPTPAATATAAPASGIVASPGATPGDEATPEVSSPADEGAGGEIGGDSESDQGGLITETLPPTPSPTGAPTPTPKPTPTPASTATSTPTPTETS